MEGKHRADGLKLVIQAINKFHTFLPNADTVARMNIPIKSNGQPDFKRYRHMLNLLFLLPSQGKEVGMIKLLI